MAWSEYQTKEQIKAVLGSMNPVAADAAKYLADLLLENQELLNDREAIGAMAYTAMVKALRDAEIPGGPCNADVILLAEEHGQMIGQVAIAMAAFVAGKSRKGWVVGAVAVGLGIAIAAMGA
jgi:hypothetical protein